MKYTEAQGYLIPAFNTPEVDYVQCAITLAKSIRHYHPEVKICLMTDIAVNHKVFDIVKQVPNLGGFKNDWQVFYASPFHETIKLEADMLLASPFEHWWTYFRKFDTWVSTGCKNYLSKTATSRRYRHLFDKNNLPDVYNAVTYWRVSPLAKTFFTTVKELMDNWHSVKASLAYATEEPVNTDLAYAIAVELLGKENFIGPYGPQITHMKPAINDLTAEDWTQQLVWEIVNGQIRVNGQTQHGLFHYHNKKLAKVFGSHYE